MSILIFIIVLSVLIIVHEFGHFATAKSLGVRVERFAVGFGPKLFSRKLNETEFAVCLIPLGGYVKMAGDERSECKGSPYEYYAHPVGHRALIVLLGPVVNYLLAYLCFCVVFLIGYPTLAPKIGEVLLNYPAQTAGLVAGDTIRQIDAEKIQSWEEAQKYIATSEKSRLEFTVVRNEKEIKLTVTPTVQILKNIFGQEEKVTVVGIKPKEEIILLKYGLAESIVRSADRLVDITTMTYKALYRIMTGAMSFKDSMTGPVGIFYIIKQAAAMGFSYLLYIVAVISASLAIFNLLPLPVLDGGHLFLLGIEKVRGRPLPIKIDEVVNRVGFSLIICLAVFVFYSDFVRFGIFDRLIDLWHKIGL